MSLNKLNIPKTITVGFQNRSDTYTNKLAYVIYTDNKGILRKESSWQGWRDKTIEPEQFDNVPTSGFVLNKKVGGNKYSWNPRNTYIRVYDPRNFEFEISVPNALFILQECSSVKGKGLEGEFVYAWDGTELVLLPVTSQEYKDSINFTDLQTKKISKTDVKEGNIFRNKDNDRVMYLGRFDWSEVDYNFNNSKTTRSTNYFLKTKKKHVFVYIDEENSKSNDWNYKKYWLQDGFTKLGTLESSNNSLFAELYDEFKSTCPNVGVDFVVEKEEYKLVECEEENNFYSMSFFQNNKCMKLHRNYLTRYNIYCYPEYENFTYEINNTSLNISKETYVSNKYYNSSSSEITFEDVPKLVGERFIYKNLNNNCVLETISN